METEVTEANVYTALTFCFDVIELIAMFIAFRFLGYFSEGSTVEAVNFDGVYGALAVAFACPALWRCLVSRSILDFYNLLCLLAVLVCLAEIVYDIRDEWLFGFLIVLLFIYILDLGVFRAWNGSRRTTQVCIVPGTYRPLDYDTTEMRYGDIFAPHPQTGEECIWQLQMTVSDTLSPLWLRHGWNWLFPKKNEGAAIPGRSDIEQAQASAKVTSDESLSRGSETAKNDSE